MKQQLNIAVGKHRTTKPPPQTGICVRVSWYLTLAVLGGRTSPAQSEPTQQPGRKSPIWGDFSLLIQDSVRTADLHLCPMTSRLCSKPRAKNLLSRNQAETTFIVFNGMQVSISSEILTGASSPSFPALPHSGPQQK